MSGNRPRDPASRPAGARNTLNGGSKVGRNTPLTVRRAEWIVAALITLTAVYLHLLYLWHAGGLWRDEAGFVRLATLASLHDVWEMLPHDHCPILAPVVLRTWWAAGWGTTDFGLRVLGLLIGLLLPMAIWAASRIMRGGFPLLPLALVALNVTAIQAGDSLRAYGLGSALSVLSLALTWRAAQTTTFVNVSLGAVAAVLSVQCLYQNAFFVFAACSGGIVVCAAGRRWRDMLGILSIGLAAAASLVPYVRPILRSQEWWVLEKAGFRFARGWENISAALSSPLPHFNWVWVALCLCAMGTALLTAWPRARRAPDAAPKNLILFGATALVVGVAGFAVFLKNADLPTQPWYYTPLMAFVAMSLDAVLAGCHRWARPALAVFAALTALAATLWGMPAIKCRQTNVDLVAERLTKDATPNDYIIVYPWYCGVSFARYYKGAAPWTTLPPLDNDGLHRYDSLKVKMQMENPLQPVLDRVASTLQSSNRVWIVGWLPLDGTPPQNLRPAPNNPWGWFDEPYSRIWGAQTGYFITTHATQGAVAMNPSTNCVNPFENLPLVSVAGWRLPPSPTAPQ